MRAVLALCLAAAACAPRAQPYRFASPMLAAADAPGAAPARASRGPRAAPLPPPRDAAPPHVHAASAEAAAAVAPPAPGGGLPAPHRLPGDAPLPPVHALADLRGLVGHRTRAAPLALALGWQAAATGAPALVASDGPALVAAAEAAGHLAPPTSAPAPGDLLSFDRTEGDGVADLIAVAIARDARGVTEYVYAAGGVVRRGFLDASRPALRRDAAGATVNTFLRAGRRWPPPGTHYLAGELLQHVIRR